VTGGARQLVIGSRASRLALWQAGWIRGRLEAAGRGVRIEAMRTAGDAILDRPLASFGGKGVFVREIEEALLDGRIDLAVHSLKDLPTEQPPGLVIACIPEREDPRDFLASSGAVALDDLRPEAVVGTGSPRRACQIRSRRPDLRIRDLRGNVETRIAKLKRGDYDAIVLALAGMRRLEIQEQGRILELDEMLPAVGQGALAVEIRAADADARAAIAPLHHPATAVAVLAERAFLTGLGGGCQAPIAAIGTLHGDRLRLRGLVGDPAGSRMIRGQTEGPATDPQGLGRALAERLLSQGAADLIAGAAAPPPSEGP